MTGFEGLRLSQQQARVMRHQMALGANLSISLRGPLDLGRLESALEACTVRHEILRTHFHRESGLAPLQVVSEAVKLPLERHSRGESVPQPTGDLPFARLAEIDEHEWELHLHLPPGLADNHSLDLWARELSDLYTDNVLDDDPFQFADFSEWQNDLQEAEPDQLDFWKDTAVITPKVVGQRQAESLPRYSKQIVSEKTLLSDVQVLACWAGLLYRINGNSQVTVHSPLAGRIDPSFESGMGPFDALAPLTLRPEPTLSLSSLADQCAAVLQAANDHVEYLPYEASLYPMQLVGFQVLAPFPNLSMGKVTAKVLDRHVEDEPFLMRLDFLEQAGGGRIELVFDQERLPEDQAHLFSETLALMMASFHEMKPLDRIKLATPKIKQRLAVDFNQTQAPLPSKAVHQLFEEQVVLNGNTIACQFGEMSLSYEELNIRSNQLSSFLKGRGITREQTVALCMDNSQAMITAILAVLKCGAAYVPLDPNYPKQRLVWMIEDSAAKMVLVDKEQSFDTKVPSINLDSLDLHALPKTNPNETVDSNQVAYLIYTSGSTGKPKAVAVPHRGVVNYLTWCKKTYGLDRGSGAPAFSSPAADLAVTGILASLVEGRTVTLSENEGLEGLAELLVECDFSFVKMTPTHLKLLAQELNSEATYPSQGCLILGGEALHEDDLTTWRQYMPNWYIINEYGPTEASVGCATFEVDGTPGPIPIGRPIFNTSLYVLDPDLELLPPTFEGELYIGGTGLARGYVNRPDLTAQRFVPNPLARKPGERLYRTGDRVRFKEPSSQNLVFLGRFDSQVKIRGFRIEPGEIECALRALPEIDDALVTVFEDRLAAYFTANAALYADELRDTLASQLPDYMVPAFFIPLDQFPMTLNGKLDLASLPVPDSKRPRLSSEYVAPSTPLEVDLVAAWSEALKVDDIGIHDNFFSLGGDSIRTVRAAALAVEKGLEMTVQDIFRYPTIAELAQYLEQSLANLGDDEQLLARIDSMSDEEAAAMLAQLEAGEEVE